MTTPFNNIGEAKMARIETGPSQKELVKIPEYTPEDITEDIDAIYAYGRCMYLAAAFQRIIGWPISVALEN